MQQDTDQLTDPMNPKVGTTGEGSAGRNLSDTAHEASAAAKEKLGGLRDEAQSAVDNAKSAAMDKTEEVKGQAAGEIDRTAHGLEAAADDLEGSPMQQDLLREAADGLRQIAQAVQGKSVGEMVGDISDFGRRNPLAFLGGAALAGFALARFARAGSPDATAGGSSYGTTGGSSYGTTGGTKGGSAYGTTGGTAGGSSSASMGGSSGGTVGGGVGYGSREGTNVGLTESETKRPETKTWPKSDFAGGSENG